MVVLFPLEGPMVVLKDVLARNGDVTALERRFRFPGGREVGFDLDVSPGNFIIVTGTDMPGGGDTGKWPLLRVVPAREM
jgi:hypothetical protein